MAKLLTAEQRGLTCVNETEKVIYVLDEDEDYDDISSSKSSARKKLRCPMSDYEQVQVTTDFDYRYENQIWSERMMKIIGDLVLEELSALEPVEDGCVMEIDPEKVLGKLEKHQGEHYHHLLELRLGRNDRSHENYKALHSNFRNSTISMYSQGFTKVNEILRTHRDSEVQLKQIKQTFFLTPVDKNPDEGKRMCQMTEGRIHPYVVPSKLSNPACTLAARIPEERELLLKDILDIAASYPLGVGYKVFMNDCKSQLGESLIPAIDTLLFQQRKIFHVVDATPEKIIFLGCLPKVTSWDSVMKCIFHYVHLVIISNKRISGKQDGISVLRMGMELLNSFKIPLNPRDWGWPDELGFYRYLILNWGIWDLEIVPGVESTEHRLQILDEAKKRQLLQPIVSDHLRKRERIYSNPFNLRAEIPRIADFLVKGHSYLTTVAQVVDLSHVIVKPAANHSLEHFIEVMTSAYNRYEKNRSLNHYLSDESIRIGSYVAYCRRKEWVRGQVIDYDFKDVHTDRSYYLIYLIDLGRIVKKVKAKALRVIHEDFASFPHQTIRCSLDDELILDGSSGEVTASVVDRDFVRQLRLLLRSKTVRITPLRRLDDELRTWKVKMGLLSNDGRVIITDVGDEVKRVNSL